MKLKVFTKEMRTDVRRNNLKQDSVMKVGKRQFEKLAKKGIAIQLFTTY